MQECPHCWKSSLAFALSLAPHSLIWGRLQRPRLLPMGPPAHAHSGFPCFMSCFQCFLRRESKNYPLKQARVGREGSKRGKCNGEKDALGRHGRIEIRGRDAQGGLKQLNNAWCNSIPGEGPRGWGQSWRRCVSIRLMKT